MTWEEMRGKPGASGRVVKLDQQWHQQTKIPAMKTKLSLVLVAALGLTLAGCSTVDSRIAKNRAAFNTWPPTVQDKVVVGKIDVGFTPDQVRVALGEPDRIWTRTASDGTSQIWSYRDYDSRDRVGFGMGMGWGWRGRGFSSIGVGAWPGYGYYSTERIGIVFGPNGTVTSVETRER